MTKTLYKYGENIEWSLPMLFQYEPVYGTIYKTMVDYNIKLPKVNLFGACASAWSGGRIPVIYHKFDRTTISRIFNYVYALNAVPTFTFTCTDIPKDDLYDEYANFLLDVGSEFGARFIVCDDKLKNYIKEKNPDAHVVASVIKPYLQFHGPEKIEEPTIEAETKFYNDLLKEYDTVVVRPEYSRGPLLENPSLIDDISRIEVLINQHCVDNCAKAPAHYKNMECFRTDLDAPYPQFECIKSHVPLCDTLSEKYNCIHTQEQTEKLVTAGVRKLKLQGRSANCPIHTLMYTMYGQMFNQDGSWFLIANDLGYGKLDRETNEFSNTLNDLQGPPVGYM